MSFMLYLWTILGHFNILLGFLIAFSILAVIAFFIVILTVEEAKDKETKNWGRLNFKRSIIVLLISVFFTVFLPSKEDAALIYILPKVAESDFAEKLSGDLRTVYDVGMAKILEELGVQEEENKKAK